MVLSLGIRSPCVLSRRGTETNVVRFDVGTDLLVPICSFQLSLLSKKETPRSLVDCTTWRGLEPSETIISGTWLETTSMRISWFG